MFDDIQDLYQELILDHNASPHNFGLLKEATHKAKGHNPLCGDDVEVFLLVSEGRIKEIKFQGQGCAISKASASLMTDAVAGKSVEETQDLFKGFHAMLTEENSDDSAKDLGKIQVFSGVREFPVRVKCATLAWHTLNAALKSGNVEPIVTTE